MRQLAPLPRTCMAAILMNTGHWHLACWTLCCAQVSSTLCKGCSSRNTCMLIKRSEVHTYADWPRFLRHENPACTPWCGCLHLWDNSKGFIRVSSSRTFLRRGIETLQRVNGAKGWASGFSWILKLSWMVPSPVNRPGNCLGTGVFSKVSTWVSRFNAWMAGSPRRFCWSLPTIYTGCAHGLSL